MRFLAGMNGGFQHVKVIVGHPIEEVLAGSDSASGSPGITSIQRARIWTAINP